MDVTGPTDRRRRLDIERGSLSVLYASLRPSHNSPFDKESGRKNECVVDGWVPIYTLTPLEA